MIPVGTLCISRDRRADLNGKIGVVVDTPVALYNAVLGDDTVVRYPCGLEVAGKAYVSLIPIAVPGDPDKIDTPEEICA